MISVLIAKCLFADLEQKQRNQRVGVLCGNPFRLIDSSELPVTLFIKSWNSPAFDQTNSSEELDIKSDSQQLINISLRPTFSLDWMQKLLPGHRGSRAVPTLALVQNEMVKEETWKLFGQPNLRHLGPVTS